jgi:hypothetical protein
MHEPALRKRQEAIVMVLSARRGIAWFGTEQK